MTKNIDTINAAVALVVKAAILAARFSGRARKRSLKPGTTAGGTATIDYIRFDTTGGYAPMPISQTIAVDGNPIVEEEGPTSDTFMVSLGVEPVQDVIITLTTDEQVTLDKNTLTFNSDNWDLVQTVTVTTVDDGVVEEITHCSEIMFAVSNSDGNYDELVMTPLMVLIEDNLCGPFG